MDKMDIDVIVESIRSVSEKNFDAYKATEYYFDLTSGNLDEGGITLVKSKILNIEKCLREWAKEHPNEGTTIMQPVESALILIDDLRVKRLLD
jgi:hypothetical protein